MRLSMRKNVDFPQPDGLRSPEDLARWHVALRASPYRVTLLLDEFDAIIKHSETKAFLAQLRSEILAPDSRIRVVLAGWSNLERAVRTGDSPAANFGENERLLPLDLEKARTLIVDVMEANGLEYADRESALKEVAGQASLHPSFLQLFLRLLFDRAFRENVLVTSDLIREIGRTDDFRKEVVRTVRENFEGWTLLAFAALLKESHSQTRETSIPTLRRRMAQYLEQQSCPVRQVSQTEFDLAKELLLKATAAEVISRPLMENRMSYTFPKALTEEEAETQAVTACQHFNTRFKMSATSSLVTLSINSSPCSIDLMPQPKERSWQFKICCSLPPRRICNGRRILLLACLQPISIERSISTKSAWR